MAKLRKACAYRKLERPYTRVSKYREKSYVKTKPNLRVVKFEMGDPKGKFSKTFRLTADSGLQIRHNSLEAARMTSNRLLERKLGRTNYHLKIKVYPFHMLRENPLASGAGADRMSTGMKMSFGKVIGLAAQVKKGQTIIEVRVNEGNEKTAKLALKRASQKIACSCSIKGV